MNSFESIESLETTPGGGLTTERLTPGSSASRAMPRLAVALECSRPLAPGRCLALDALDQVIVGRGTSSRIDRAGRAATLDVNDIEASRQHLAIRRCVEGWQVEDLGSRNGTAVNGEPVRVATLIDGDVIEAGGAMLMFFDGAAPGEPRDRGLAELRVAGLAGTSSASSAVYRTLSLELEHRLAQVRKIAPYPVAVLVRGETGTGKELAARAIHDVSGRSGAFVPVNCGALPRELIESELFGHRRGAFSGAAEDREGLIRRAHKGTLFLDEIAELPPDSQVALLRVLQDGEVRPVGASEATQVDVRIVAATHQDLTRRIAEGRFREDLYARIAGFEVTMPPLRDRREDLGLLIASILPRVCAEPELVTLHKRAARALFGYRWPLNIRELEQALRAATALCDGRQIRLEHLPAVIRDHQPLAAATMDEADAALRERLIELLHASAGNVAAVGRVMERAPNQIRRWCHRLQIDLTQFRQ
jgi:transcriptional regulator with AAA-type ATPase domain